MGRFLFWIFCNGKAKVRHSFIRTETQMFYAVVESHSGGAEFTVKGLGNFLSSHRHNRNCWFFHRLLQRLKWRKSDQPHLQFLQDSTHELSMLNKHTAIKSVFLHFSSVIPSSAPVERPNSAQQQSFSANDETAWMTISSYLKLNKDFW